jgi:hypothetical protein
MKKSDLYAALRTDLHRHDFSTFVDYRSDFRVSSHFLASSAVAIRK